jgi:predicted transcriptional regulator
MFQSVLNPEESQELGASGPVPDVAAVRALFPREREVASIVYALGAATACRVQRCVAPPLSNAAVRSMLNRLVRKAVLSRSARDGPSGKFFVYAPAISIVDARREAMRQFAEDYFDGSVSRAAHCIFELLAAECGAPRFSGGHRYTASSAR